MSDKKLKKAYSLLELSIVIVIISILISGALSVSVSSINKVKIKVTKDRMQEIYEAVGNFLVINRRLPCPASITSVKGSSDYGDEVGHDDYCEGSGSFRSNSHSGLIYGMVPARTLGLTDDMVEDAFGNKISYMMHRKFTYAADVDDLDYDVDSFSTKRPTDRIDVIGKTSSGSSQDITGDAIFILISHGANEYGAFGANSSIQNERSSDSDEKNNDINITDDVSIPNKADYNEDVIISTARSEVFDDIVMFKRRNDFVKDFDAMSLIPCANDGSDDESEFFEGDDDSGSYYGEVNYADDPCSNPAYPRKSRRCEAYGRWMFVVGNCP